MDHLDLFDMRERFNQQQIMLSFNGPISRSLIEEIGNALRNYLQADHAHPSAAMDVFAVYIEMTQNIRHYANRKEWAEHDASATVVISRDPDGRYIVSAGNMIEREDGDALIAKIEALAQLDKAALKAVYKQQLRQPHDPVSTTGAGLGLIDIARKTSSPIAANLRDLSNGRAFLSLRAII